MYYTRLTVDNVRVYRKHTIAAVVMYTRSPLSIARFHFGKRKPDVFRRDAVDRQYREHVEGRVRTTMMTYVTKIRPSDSNNGPSETQRIEGLADRFGYSF